MITNDFFSLNFGDPLTKTNRELVQTWALAFMFGRLNYSFKGRYLLEASSVMMEVQDWLLKTAGRYFLLFLQRGE